MHDRQFQVYVTVQCSGSALVRIRTEVILRSLFEIVIRLHILTFVMGDHSEEFCHFFSEYSHWPRANQSLPLALQREVVAHVQRDNRRCIRPVTVISNTVLCEPTLMTLLAVTHTWRQE